MITFRGIALAVQSAGALIVLLVFFTIAFGYPIRVEEKALLSELGDSYASYVKRTKTAHTIPHLGQEYFKQS